MLAAPIALLLVFKPRDRNAVLVVLAIVLAIVIFVPGYFAYPVARSATQVQTVGGFEQTINGNLESATVTENACTENGPCIHEDHYCDPKEHMEYTKDSKGNITGVRTWTTYSDCPFMTKEYTFIVTDTFGNEYIIASHWFAAKPELWRGGVGVDRSGADSVSRGIPPEWQKLKDQIDAGDAPPVTVPNTYDNIVLGSKYTEHSDDIPVLQQNNLLPAYTRDLEGNPFYDRYKADKAVFVGMNPPNNAVWQDQLMRFNADLGMTKQGDLHIVAVRAAALTALGLAPEDYIRALKAHWSNDFGKKSLPKNAIIVALGVDNSGTTVQWARAQTGMPVGNNEMLDAIAYRANGIPFQPDALLGQTKARIVAQPPNGKLMPTYTAGGGLLSRIIMTDQPFKRSCMRCTDESEKGQQGFVDLEDLIDASTGNIIWAIIILTLIAMLLLAGCIGSYGYFSRKWPRFMKPPTEPNAPTRPKSYSKY
jgi:hypothetical protein